ncbi:butyrophilin-like protein 2 isoform X1 [Myxocyprinus asiaticus]|uniref:butyrophilin-like protein 2 isoform X1 n=1 Tax=Myxocyprinus asiaticus TaxID=70543 RepID=UPI002223421A|nr:butyrophilin-like protein 2 isoform X1 [Myxocyprinus asiaticus]
MEIEWYNESSCVCTYKNRHVTEGVGYEGRASLFIQDLKKGNVSLRLSDFKESDLGVYLCRVTSQNKTDQITVNVGEEVTAFFKDQHVFIMDYKMAEKPNKLRSHFTYHSASGKDQHGDYKMGETIYKSLSCSAYDSASGKDQHGEYMGEASNNNFQLVIPKTEDAQVSLGSELIVPCSLIPEISAVAMEIKWHSETGCVCVYKDRQLTAGIGYNGRVSLFTHELKRGNVSLRLKNFSWSDVGKYTCQVICGDETEEITVKVRLDPGVQPVSQSPIFQGQNAQLMIFKDTKMKETTTKFSSHAPYHADSVKNQHENYKMRASSNDQFQLVVTKIQKAQISLGSEFTVPCHLTPGISAVAMEIRWFKETDCVCLYKNRQVTEVTSGDRAEEITIGVRMQPEVQSVSQSPVQGHSVQLMLSEIDRIWTKEETMKMDQSALMAVMKVNDPLELINVYTERMSILERTELQLRETRMDLDRVLRLIPHVLYRNRDNTNPFK